MGKLKEVADIYEGAGTMFFKNMLKCIALFLISVVIMSIILYSTGVVCLIFGVFNEYIFGCFLGVVYSAIILWIRNKKINKFKISNKLYLISTTLTPAIFFITCCVFLHNSNTMSSILNTNLSELMYYFIFMSFAFSVATIIVTIIELLHFLVNSGR